MDDWRFDLIQILESGNSLDNDGSRLQQTENVNTKHETSNLLPLSLAESCFVSGESLNHDRQYIPVQYRT